MRLASPCAAVMCMGNLLRASMFIQVNEMSHLKNIFIPPKSLEWFLLPHFLLVFVLSSQHHDDRLTAE